MPHFYFLGGPSLNSQPTSNYSIFTILLTSQRSLTASRSLKPVSQPSALLRSPCTPFQVTHAKTELSEKFHDCMQENMVVRMWAPGANCLTPVSPSPCSSSVTSPSLSSPFTRRELSRAQTQNRDRNSVCLGESKGREQKPLPDNTENYLKSCLRPSRQYLYESAITTALLGLGYCLNQIQLRSQHPSTFKYLGCLPEMDGYK